MGRVVAEKALALQRGGLSGQRGQGGQSTASLCPGFKANLGQLCIGLAMKGQPLE